MLGGGKARARWVSAVSLASIAECGPEVASAPHVPQPLGPSVLSVEEQASLRASTSQRRIFRAWLALEAGLLVRAATMPGVLPALAAAPLSTTVGALALFIAAWVAADLSVGIFHVRAASDSPFPFRAHISDLSAPLLTHAQFFVDNYGSGCTSVIGSVIEGFQHHHERPWLITRGELCTVVEGPCVATMPLQLAALLLGGPCACVFMTFLAFWKVMAQVSHAWSHERRTALPPFVALLQDARVLISCKEHRQHHLPPINDHYCILSGLWNGPLDRLGVFPAIERAVFALTGNAPRSWDERGATRA